MMTRDIHHHFIPDVLKARVADLPDWSAKESIRFMDENGIDKASLSLSYHEIDFSTKADFIVFCQSVNNELASVVHQYPDRFEAFATLPFPHIDACAGEVARCKAMGFAGFTLYTNVKGTYPSTVDHAALFKAVESTGLPLFIHPASTPPEDCLNEEVFSDAIEYPQEVTRLMSRFLAEDGFERFPELSLLLAHGGGILSFQFARLGKLPYMKASGDVLKIRWGRIIGDMMKKRTRMEDYMERMSFDLYDADGPEQLAALETVAIADRMHYGSNFPFQGA
jgi:predicted TIM-barrel fold metal-dependent hydrolase